MEPYHADTAEATQDTRSSRLGIASFSLGISAIFFGLLAFFAPSMFEEYSVLWDDVPCIGLISAILMAIVGLGLGIAAVVQRGRSKTFGILGIVFTVLVLLSLGCLSLVTWIYFLYFFF